MNLIAMIFSQMTFAVYAAPSAFPIFLKEGFSSILEFEENPTQVVLGDQNLFQVERLGKSIIIKPLTPYATTNMFVYFKAKDTKLFILKASEEADPTFFKKFEDIVPVKSEVLKTTSASRKYSTGLNMTSLVYDNKKDYLTVDFVVAADSTGKIAPSWDLVRLKYKDKIIAPSKLWSERREAQRDSYIKARLIFIKPNVPENLKDVSIIVPTKGNSKPFIAKLKVGR